LSTTGRADVNLQHFAVSVQFHSLQIIGLVAEFYRKCGYGFGAHIQTLTGPLLGGPVRNHQVDTATAFFNAILQERMAYPAP
jgi:hypothetical protein